jgi:outer membrane murein-binding lipoprotein Lpp
MRGTQELILQELQKIMSIATDIAAEVSRSHDLEQAAIAEIAKLGDQVRTLQGQVGTLQGQVSALQAEVDAAGVDTATASQALVDLKASNDSLSAVVSPAPVAPAA